MDFTLPEVAILGQSPRFFKEGDKDFIEISFTGSKDTIVKRVEPKHMAQFRDEWNAYCDGQPMQLRKGTPLSDLPSIQGLRVEHYTSRNVHNLEELAALSDGQCQSLGHGALTDRGHAQKLLTQRKMEADERARQAVSDASATIGVRPADKYASQTDLDDVKAQLGTLTQSIQALVQAIADKPKRGRPPKDKAEE